MELQEKVEQAAKTCHEVNRVYCESLGDASQPSWEDAPDWQKNSAIDGVKNIIDSVIKTPSDSHKSWLAEKEKTGWVYGKVKDPEKKTHPYILPYEELPLKQRIKDELFMAVVRSFLSSIELDELENVPMKVDESKENMRAIKYSPGKKKGIGKQTIPLFFLKKISENLNNGTFRLC